VRFLCSWDICEVFLFGHKRVLFL